MMKSQLWKRIFGGGAVLAACLIMASGAQANVVWDESLDGDLSNSGAAPTMLLLAVGDNFLSATSTGGPGIEREYVAFNMPPNSRLVAVLMEAYSNNNGDGTAFIAVQSGLMFTEPPTGTNPANLLGYAHFGDAIHSPGDDVLPEIGQGFGSMGFTPPLPGGAYTFWIQQTGPSSSTYTFNFVVVPEPGAVALVGSAVVAICLGVMRRCRNR